MGFSLSKSTAGSCNSSRVNLTIPIDVAIELEKICTRKGMKRTAFMAAAVKEKVYDQYKGDLIIERLEKIASDIEKIKEDIEKIQSGK